MGTCPSNIFRTRRNRPVLKIKNKKLKKRPLRWIASTENLQCYWEKKQTEFWETAPVFDGREEIWLALQSAVGCIKNNDYTLAQAIIDGAGITTPNGNLQECYDEFGAKYSIPQYVYSLPDNLKLTEQDDNSDQNIQNTNRTINENEPTSTNNIKLTFNDPVIKKEKIKRKDSITNEENIFPIKLRLSTGKEVHMKVNGNMSVSQLKSQLSTRLDEDIGNGRFCYSGRLLKDHWTLDKSQLSKGDCISVILHKSS
ncbi:hypothetical protein SNEBB_005894 [Seison nebaliae]|nr:hypothetical protein SNEBB_005894 [Seison nebaliae]